MKLVKLGLRLDLVMLILEPGFIVRAWLMRACFALMDFWSCASTYRLAIWASDFYMEYIEAMKRKGATK